MLIKQSNVTFEARIRPNILKGLFDMLVQLPKKLKAIAAKITKDVLGSILHQAFVYVLHVFVTLSSENDCGGTIRIGESAWFVRPTLRFNMLIQLIVSGLSLRTT